MLISEFLEQYTLPQKIPKRKHISGSTGERD